MLKYVLFSDCTPLQLTQLFIYVECFFFATEFFVFFLCINNSHSISVPNLEKHEKGVTRDSEISCI